MQKQIEKALQLVRQYITENFPALTAEPTLFIVWQSTILQNFKCSISTVLPARMSFELTYDGDGNCWYLDVYRKVENRVIPDD